MQLALPLDLPLQKSKPIDTSRIKRQNIVVRELMTFEQDLEVLRLTEEFVNDVDLNETFEEENVLRSCIHIRNDIERKHINLFIAYEGNKPIGFLVGVATHAFHRPGIVAEQKLCYTSPDKRGSSAALHLVEAFERWARLNGATQIFTGTANKRYAERTSKFFEKIGYARVGTLHVKEI